MTTALKLWSTIVEVLYVMIMRNWNFKGKLQNGFVTRTGWSYFKIVGGLKELGHVNIKEL